MGKVRIEEAERHRHESIAGNATTLLFLSVSAISRDSGIPASASRTHQEKNIFRPNSLATTTSPGASLDYLHSAFKGFIDR